MKTYKFGQTIKSGKERYRIGSAIGKWAMCLMLPGVGLCGLYPKKKK